MNRTTTYQSSVFSFAKGKIRDYMLLVKFRLSLIVVFSAVAGLLLAAGTSSVSFAQIFYLALGGFLITGCANGLNQVIEKEFDKKMVRTQNRPLAADRMTVVEAIIACGIMGFAGIITLWYSFNAVTALLGTLSLITYAFIYTPMKRVSPIAVFIGAIPGALPPMIGFVALQGTISFEAFVLFSIQFLWQFPHFWAIAWVCDDDYRNAGFRLMPSANGRSKQSAFQNILYIIFLIPVSLIPFFIHQAGIISAVIILLIGLVFLAQSVNLYNKCTVKSARTLMFGSFIYLPVVLASLVIDKI